MFPEKYFGAVVGLELRSLNYKSATLSTQPPGLMDVMKLFSIYEAIQVKLIFEKGACSRLVHISNSKYASANALFSKIKLKLQLLHILKRTSLHPSNLVAELIEWQTCN